jgi:hypothetical protein
MAFMFVFLSISLFFGMANWDQFKTAFRLTFFGTSVSILLLVGTALWELVLSLYFKLFRPDQPAMTSRDKASRVGLFLIPLAAYCGLFVYNLFWGVNKHGAEIAEKRDPFVATVEYARVSVGAENGTSLWFRYPSGNGGCGGISPIKGLYFLNIRNASNAPMSVVGYGIEVLGVPLVRVRTRMGIIVGTPNVIDGHFLHHEIKINNLRVGSFFDFAQGPGFSMVTVPLNQSDFSRGIALKMDLIDELLQQPLQPGKPIRGWAFFQPPNPNAPTIAGPGHLILETDDGRTFSYPFDLRYPHSDLDNMHRVITVESFLNLWDCKIL